MAEIVWSPQSLRDLDSIAEYIARDSPYYAKIFVERITRQTEYLRQFALMGRRVPESSNPTHRELIYKKYRIIYQAGEEKVNILTVFHTARLLDADTLFPPQ